MDCPSHEVHTSKYPMNNNDVTVFHVKSYIPIFLQSCYIPMVVHGVYTLLKSNNIYLLSNVNRYIYLTVISFYDCKIQYFVSNMDI